MDLLLKIRDFIRNKKEIVEMEDSAIFDDIVFPLSAKTSFIICGTDKPGSTKDYYTLESILFLLQNREYHHLQYMRMAEAACVPLVYMPDRRALLAYLFGGMPVFPGIEEIDEQMLYWT